MQKHHEYTSLATRLYSRVRPALRPALDDLLSRQTRRRRHTRLGLELLEQRSLLSSTGDPTTLAPSLGPPPSPGPNVIWVNTQSALQNAVSNLKSGQTIVIQPGTYNLSSTLYIGHPSQVTNVTIRGSTDNFNDVVLLGNGMDNASYGNVPMGISIFNAQNVTIADLSIGNVYDDPIEVKGDVGASSVTIYHVHLFDAGEQFIKVDPPSSGVGASNSAVQYSMINYTNGPPTTDHGGGIGYTNGIDIHDGSNWTISHNLIENLHTPDSVPSVNQWNPAILIWNHSSNITVDGNTIINCDRAIAFGLIDQTSGYDNQGGIIRNNFIYQAPGLFSSSRAAASDGQILVWDSPNTAVDQNTILTNGNSLNSIQTRWTTTGAEFKNNLADAPTRNRDGGALTTSGNYLSAIPSMFVSPSTGDLHLVSNSATQANVIDKVAPLTNVTTDWDGNARPIGSNADIGADEYQSSTTDTAPPTISAQTPSPNASSVAVTSTVTATFSEPVQAGTIGFTLKNASGTAVGASVAYNSSNNIVTLTPSASLGYSTTYTASLSGTKDNAGNTMAPVSWSFTTSAAPSQPAPAGAYSLWASTATPTVSSDNDSSSVELGVKFQSNVAGSITGIRFYKSSANTGTHVGHLWDSSGNSLATATFTGETASGWQQVNFATPVAITANTTYVASYFAPAGHYADDTNYFATSHSNGPLTALADGASGLNGVYSYGSTSTFPTNGWQASNYWVDVVFNTSVTDTTPPTVVSQNPGNGATGVAVTITAKATFSEPIQASTISFTLKNAAGTAVAATVSYDTTSKTAILTPNSPLAYSTSYTATVSGTKDLAGNVMTAPISETFTTASAPPANTTPPTVTTCSPAYYATGVAVASPVSATFSEAVKSSTISLVSKNSPGTSIAGSVAYNSSTQTVTLTPSSPLASSTTYTATVSGATDNAGNTMAPVSWSFTTLASSSPPVSSSPPTSSSASNEPLLTQSNLQYVGAFRLPDTTLGASSFNYGGSAIAYNPANNSLFMVGMPYDQAIAEVAIPNPVNSTNLNSLPVASVLQPFSSILPRIPNNPSNLSTGGTEAIGGLMVDNGQLIGTVFNTYDGTGSVTLSHFVLGSLNLASASVSGLYQVGTMGGGFVGGYMMPVPSEWQSALGAPFLTGQGGLSIISRTSYGPSAFGFNPANFGSNPTPDIPYLYYPSTNPTLGAWDSNYPTGFNGTTNNNGNNTPYGAVFVPGTRTVLYFSSIGTGNFYYGEASGANDPNRTSKGPHSVGGNYVWQVQAYDANDFVAVKNGQKNPWDVTPYATWNISLPVSDGSKYMGGVAFDPTSGRLYLSELDVDNSRSQYDSNPLIQVFQLTLPTAR